MMLSEADFLKCTPRYWRLRLDGMRHAQQQQYRNQWEITRWAVATGMAPHLKKPIEPKRLVQFPWEAPAFLSIHDAVKLYSHIFDKLTPNPEA
ncbi:hypothetical protein [Runella sp.]|jgi:hypothetical protein|uniref:hypothetical protein n=1 Tax=Runella sp. TaxID=1960881 RepID=UPI00301889EB